MSYFTDEDLRQKLKEKINGRKQIDVAAEVGISSAFLSQVLHGDPVSGKILKWLGFRRGPKIYVEQ